MKATGFTTYFKWNTLKPWLHQKFRFLFFYVLMFAILGGFVGVNHRYILPYESVEYGVSLIALGWWLQSWVCLMLAELIWPILILLFFKVSKERTPKRIISIGEKFRKYNLSSPQIWSLDERVPFLSNRILGWPTLPSPFGSILLVKKGFVEGCSNEAYIAWTSRQACEQKTFHWSAWSHVLITSLPALYILCTGVFPNWPLPFVIIGVSVGFLALSYSREKARQRLIDIKTVKDFSYSVADYQKWQKEWMPFFKTQVLEDSVLKDLGDKPVPRFVEIMNVLVAGFSVAGVCAIALTGPLPSSFQNRRTPAQAAPSNKANLVEKQVAAATVKPESSVVSKSEPGANMTSQAIAKNDFRQLIHSLSARGNIHIQDSALGGATPLQLAVAKGDFEMIYILLVLGADVKNEVDLKGEDVLFYAVRSDAYLTVTPYILQTAVKVHTNKQGLTALDVARQLGRTEIYAGLQALMDRDRAPASSFQPVPVASAKSKTTRPTQSKTQRTRKKHEKIYLRF